MGVGRFVGGAMGCPACQLIWEAHVAFLEKLSEAVGAHVDGIGQAVRLFRRRGRLSGPSTARILRVDNSFGTIRNITRHSVRTMLLDLEDEHGIVVHRSEDANKNPRAKH